ncbi:MAG: SDR family NAD(P)-dependent oxidoreductase [Lewinellaceae bacterium]|nr:SDR family NAD(P)-dependent oxidoreductase [Saprospiraceae bacterium]MCB9355853.1 SDR family NAD(P)-dependent oxidoreductase [Lewinellaceae bacterium]
MTILVTGGAGFIGSHLCEHLLGKGIEVVCIDNFDRFYDPAVKEQNISGLEENARFHLYRGDIRDESVLKSIFRQHQVDSVVHLAAKAGVRPSIQHPAEYMDVNITGTVRLLEAMRQAGVGRLIFGSSSSIYGNQSKVPFSENDDVSEPISPYAASKRSGELIAYTYHHLYGMEVSCLRFFTVYGPRQRPDLAIHKFTQLALSGRAIPLYGDGLTRRDYTYVDDIVQGIARLIDHPVPGFDIFNLGNGHPITLLDMVRALESALGKKLEIAMSDKQPGDVEQTFADISKARSAFGYTPRIDFNEGVRRFVEWYALSTVPGE